MTKPELTKRNPPLFVIRGWSLVIRCCHHPAFFRAGYNGRFVQAPNGKRSMSTRPLVNTPAATQNVRVEGLTPLLSPRELQRELPGAPAYDVVRQSRSGSGGAISSADTATDWGF